MGVLDRNNVKLQSQQKPINQSILWAKPIFQKPKCDPIPLTEMDIHDPLEIKNNGQSLYSFGTFNIVDPYATNDEIQEDRNVRNGYGCLRDPEVYVLQESAFYRDQERNDFLNANYDDTWKYDKEIYR